MRKFEKSLALAGVVLLGLLPLAIAHGHDGDGDGEMAMDMSMGEASVPRPTIHSNLTAEVPGPPSYFQYGEHSGLIVAHILLMTIGWVFVLPIGECWESFEFSHSFLIL